MPNPNRYLDRDCNLLRTYGYADSGMLRQTLHADNLTKSSRVVRRFKDGACDAVTYAVSRLERN